MNVIIKELQETVSVISLFFLLNITYHLIFNVSLRILVPLCNLLFLVLLPLAVFSEDCFLRIKRRNYQLVPVKSRISKRTPEATADLFLVFASILHKSC